MTSNFGNPTYVTGNIGDGGLAVSQGSSDHGLRRSLRGKFALGALFVMATASYAVVFVLFDNWYKGGSLGLL